MYGLADGEAAGLNRTKLKTQNNEGNIRMNNIWILAQTGNDSGVSSVPVAPESESVTSAPGAGEPNAGSNGQRTPGNIFPWWLFLPLLILMFFMFFRAPQKQKQQRKKLEQSLEKNDKVLTIGGIIGTIVDLKDDEITLKVDESNNTKIKVRRSAIGKNMSKE
jgi:preprotein translocase subunit YajC